MRSIKLKVVSWIIGLLFIVGACIAQDTTVTQLPFDTSTFGLDITVETNPVEVYVNTEDLENNEPLQKLLELETEQTNALNRSLTELNQTIESLPNLKIMATQGMLDLYGVNPAIVDKKYRVIHILCYLILTGYLLSAWYSTKWKYNLLYWTRKRNVKNVVEILSMAAVLGIVLPKLLCLLFIDNYHLWSNIEKLF